MAPKVGFFTPINFGDQPKSNTEWLLEKADGFFYLGGPKAHLIKTNQAVLVNESQSLLVTCLKVASYFTILLPTIPLLTQVENPLAMTCLKALSCFAFLVPIILIAKAVLRCTHSYEIDARSIKSLAHQPIDPSVIDTLGLNLDEEATVDASKLDKSCAPYIPTKPFILREVAAEVIAKINEAIEKKSIANPQASEQEKHIVMLCTFPPYMEDGSNLFFYEWCCGTSYNSHVFYQEPDSNSWFNRIIQALVDRNHIQLIDKTGHANFIQA